MRRLLSARSFSRSIAIAPTSPTSRAFLSVSREPRRFLAIVRDVDNHVVNPWFKSSAPHLSSHGLGPENEPKPDERTLKLGKSMLGPYSSACDFEKRKELKLTVTAIRVLHDRLPTLLESPLPQEILSPQITLNLFPSTHPHLPTVSGRIAYKAALWTAPVAWGKIPVLANVKLHIMSERLIKNGGGSNMAGLRHERLVVKWKTCGNDGQVKKIAEFLTKDKNKTEEFCGLFIFRFDEEGRIVSHTIEHTDEGGLHDQTAKVISVTDWLLGRAWGKRDDVPGLALGYCEHHEPRRRISHRKRE